jgi:hypothetical protein
LNGAGIDHRKKRVKFIPQFRFKDKILLRPGPGDHQESRQLNLALENANSPVSGVSNPKGQSVRSHEKNVDQPIQLMLPAN